MQQLVTNTLPDCAGMGFEATAASPDRFMCIDMANSMESSAARWSRLLLGGLIMEEGGLIGGSFLPAYFLPGGSPQVLFEVVAVAAAVAVAKKQISCQVDRQGLLGGYWLPGGSAGEAHCSFPLFRSHCSPHLFPRSYPPVHWWRSQALRFIILLLSCLLSILLYPSPFSLPPGALVAGAGSAIHCSSYSYYVPPPPRQVHWWRAQAVRFIMRWPSAHLCHVTNQERHRAFGTLAANHVARFLLTQSEALSSLSHSTAPAASATSAPTSAAATSAAPTALNVPANANATGSATGGGDNANGTDASWSLGVQEPYMPRPIVSLHVRGTDKFAEMGLTSLDSHLFHMNRLRQHGLDLSHVWLNTETQANVDRAADQPSWTFFYSSNARQQDAAGSLRQYERDQSVAVSFASVLIAAQCDYFVGSLGSNWSRLMNELRSTNGRLLAGFVAVNFGEW
ncbi:unnamed protein product [Closterium sp. NIES-54]